MTAGHRQRVLALFPPAPRTTPRGAALDRVLRLRCMRAWITPGAYAWWVYSGDIKRAQQDLVALRRAA